ncbi:transmembrane protein 132C [Chanos chanos]|uniref:Transmembrane protein 132C n=1 Tax=Chanos chanos TaxID=29144 RepID=A0A6J2WHA0_CHACN|nr:transmembrane protein 132C-like [Chanos chanos]
MALEGAHRTLMGCVSSSLLILLWCLLLARAQPLPSVSLPAQINVLPPWRSLRLSQADLGLLFTNSSPYTFTQSLLLRPPPETSTKPSVRASFGPYSVNQLVSDPIAPLSPSLTASLLTKTVVREKEGDRGERLKVRVLFHMRGDNNRGTCVTLHAFKETEEQKASCITQPPLGLCVVTLTLPKDWFDSDQDAQLNPLHTHRQRHVYRHRPRYRGRQRQNIPASLKRKPAVPTNQIQLYYSSFGRVSNFKISPPRCVEDSLQQSERKLYYIGSASLDDKGLKDNKTKQSFLCLDGQEEVEQWLDSNVLIRYNKGPGHVGQPLGMSVNLRSNFSGEFLIVRLKVKKGLLAVVAQPVRNSNFWSITMEKTSGTKHDTISLICHKNGSLDKSRPSAFQQVACFSVNGIRRSFGVAMTVATSWWVEYSSRNTLVSPHGAVTNFISFTDREIVGIAPITESNTIINTAILTSQPVSHPVIVLAVGQDGKVSDVTSAVRCQSTNEDIVKVSSDCSALFVDGSESGMGSTCVGVEFSLGTLTGSLCMAVWAPVVPLRIFLSDSVLSPIDGWSYYSENRCSPVFQRSSVQVLAQFSAKPSAKGDHLTYMLGSPDWFVDVTELVRDWLRIENPRVATLDKQGYLIGLKPGLTSLHVISSQWDGVLGSADITVTGELVTPGDLSVQLVGGLGLSINPSPSNPSVVTATATAHNTLYNHGQEASISIWLQFSDDTAILVSAFSGVPYSLRLSSLAESVVAVTPAPSQRIIAQGDGGGPLLKAELLVSTCEPVSNDIVMDEGRAGGGTRRLAKGSGWIRVNLEADLWPMENEDADFEFLDISDMLVESDKDAYSNSGDKEDPVNSTDDYDNAIGNEMIARNVLEKAVLTPNHEETAVYISPGLARENEGRENGERELEVGIGAVLSLLCLSSLLFLVNCLPCALREQRRRNRRRATKGGRMEGEETGFGALTAAARVRFPVREHMFCVASS